VRATSAGEGQGATFTVRLPLTAVQRDDEPGHQALRIAPDFRPPDLSGITVLVVDDQSDARDLLKRVLQDCDAAVVTAGSAEEALRVVEARHGRLRAAAEGSGPRVSPRKRLPAIALTALARSEDRTRALRAGFLAHVAKPVEPSELVATVASVVGRAGYPLAD
jgi:CheY-like chemotaxis protein